MLPKQTNRSWSPFTSRLWFPAAPQHAPSCKPSPRTGQRSSRGVTWHAVLVRLNASTGDVNLFCLRLSFAFGCLSLFFDQIKLDGFHNCASATVMLQTTEKLHKHTSDIAENAYVYTVYLQVPLIQEFNDLFTQLLWIHLAISVTLTSKNDLYMSVRFTSHLLKMQKEFLSSDPCVGLFPFLSTCHCLEEQLRSQDRICGNFFFFPCSGNLQDIQW